MLDLIQPFVISLSIGLLVGIERERSKHRTTQTMGVRSFMLLGMLGTIAAQVSSPWMAAVIALFATVGIWVGYWQSTSHNTDQANLGLTSELAAGIVFGLGYLAKTDAFLTVLLGVVVLVILLSRDRLHQFSVKHIEARELTAAATILVLSIVVAPFLPDKTIDPWELFNPRRFILILIALSLIQFGGYLALRIFGPRFGLPLTGFLGGLVSSTAMFLDLAHRAKRDSTFARHAYVAGMFAQTATLVELVLLALGAFPELALYLVPPVVVMSLACLCGVWLVNRRRELASDGIEVEMRNPLDLQAAAKLAAIFSLALAAIAIGHRFADEGAVYILAFLGGSLELQSIAMAALAMNAEGKIDSHTALVAVGLAVAASILSKLAILWGVNRGRFALLASATLIAALGLGAATAAFVLTNL